MKKITTLLILSTLMSSGCMKKASIVKYDNHWTAYSQAKDKNDVYTRITQTAQAVCANRRSRGYATFLEEITPTQKTEGSQTYYEASGRFYCADK